MAKIATFLETQNTLVRRLAAKTRGFCGALSILAVLLGATACGSSTESATKNTADVSAATNPTTAITTGSVESNSFVATPEGGAETEDTAEAPIDGAETEDTTAEAEAVPEAAAGQYDLFLDGESGSLDNISKSLNAEVSAVSKNGLQGITIDSQVELGYVHWGPDQVPQGEEYAAARFWVQIESTAPGESTDLMTIANAENSKNFDFFMTGDTQKFKWDILNSSHDESDFQVNLGQWYLVEILVNFSGLEHVAQVRIDGVDQGEIRSNGVDTSIKTVAIGSWSAKTHRQHYDDVAVEISDIPISWITP